MAAAFVLQCGSKLSSRDRSSKCNLLILSYLGQPSTFVAKAQGSLTCRQTQRAPRQRAWLIRLLGASWPDDVAL